MSNIERCLRGFVVVLCLVGILIPNTVTALSTPSATSSSPSSGSNEDDECDEEGGQKPNIIIILADDMGWNDASFHGSNQIPTPNIDAIAFNGVVLNQHYVPALCTPSRSALMTGKYPIHLGTQHSVILATEPRGLPLNERLLPEYLKEAGYKTHAVGKWHLGFHKSEYTPTRRGFDSHYGYWNGLQDYYTHDSKEVVGKYKDFIGYDMRINAKVNWDAAGKYSTDLFTDEAIRVINGHNTSEPMFLYLAHLAPHSGNENDLLQAPDEEIAKFPYIQDPERRIYAAMVSKLDQGVGDVIAALRNRGMLKNSVILFMSDNGAPTSGLLANHGSNYPLRGKKDGPWEGGSRGVAAIWSPLIKKQKRVSNQMLHVTDWLPTLLSAAGLDNKSLPTIDGKNLWPALVSDSPSPRSEILVNIDDIDNYAALRRGAYKYIIGTSPSGQSWEGESGRPDDEEEEGISPRYDPNRVLQSKAGVAIAGVVTAKQVMEVRERKKRRTSVEERVPTGNLKSQLLTADEIIEMRQQATVYCNVEKVDRIACDPLEGPCLFNILKDPCEMRNLAEKRPATLVAMEYTLMKYRMTALPPANADVDAQSNPALWNNTWACWRDNTPLSQLTYMNGRMAVNTSTPSIIIAGIIVGLLIVSAMLVFGLKHKKYVPSSDETAVKPCAGPMSIIFSPSKTVQSTEQCTTFRNIGRDID